MKPADSRIIEVTGYHLTGLIGSGGMGDVYKGYQESLDRTVAVKILHSREFAGRFRNEAYIQSAINHPNIACLYEYITRAERPCIVMEYVAGESIDSLLKQQGRFSNAETTAILRQIAAALAYLHKNNIMHRDIKPQNFRVQPDGIVKMLDFGIAKHKYSPKITQLGSVIGTPEYIAPEQFDEKPVLKSDVWALSVMTYEMVTGFLPFESGNPLLLRSKITHGSYTNPKLLTPDISDGLLAVIEKGLRVNPASRIAAQEIPGLLSPANSHFTRAAKKMNIRQKPFFIAAIVLTVLVMFLFIGSKRTGTAAPPTAQADNTADQKTIMINASGIEGAEIIFGDRQRAALPFPVRGKEGEKIEFTIHARGYKDKKVKIEITSRRNAYEFDLEKTDN
jgi:serine/threonine-protein kinase